MEHIETKLSDKQLRVVVLLVAGETVTEAAKRVQISRSTVHRWLKESVFAAAINRARRQLYEEQTMRIAALGSDALSTLEAAVKGGDSKAALAVAKGLGLLPGVDMQFGSEDPSVLRGRQADERMLERLGLGL